MFESLRAHQSSHTAFTLLRLDSRDFALDAKTRVSDLLRGRIDLFSTDALIDCSRGSALASGWSSGRVNRRRSHTSRMRPRPVTRDTIGIPSHLSLPPVPPAALYLSHDQRPRRIENGTDDEFHGHRPSQRRRAMCPLCMTTMAWAIGGVTSTGGITGLVASKLRSKTHKIKGERHGARDKE